MQLSTFPAAALVPTLSLVSAKFLGPNQCADSKPKADTLITYCGPTKAYSLCVLGDDLHNDNEKLSWREYLYVYPSKFEFGRMGSWVLGLGS